MYESVKYNAIKKKFFYNFVHHILLNIQAKKERASHYITKYSKTSIIRQRSGPKQCRVFE
jgi:hypothetical protein